MARSLDDFIAAVPKAELHLHIEGTLEPELMFALAERNKLKLRFASVAAVRAAYEFADLQSFLDIYYEGAAVLRTEQDFHDLAWAYLTRVAPMGVRHAEIFFDPQTHTSRGIPYKVVLDGLTSALARAEKQLGLTSRLILSFLRHLSEDEALAVLKEALPLGKIHGVGLDSSEKGNPPSKFARAYAKARAAGLRAAAHAGEEGPPAYVSEALDLLKAERVDHGVRCLEDARLVARLAEENVPLTVCPLSNVKLRVVDRLEDHPLRKMLRAGLRASVNSDDPAYFGGYADENYRRTARALKLTKAEVARLASNSFLSSWLPDAEKARALAEIKRLAS
ncbi:MAG TPA: adenosine deaminase [Elusimicrobiota bacterium]|nr:adenosine deaminase [Elusimicrobiota bacterium]